MPAATAWSYKQRFSPDGHCVISSTTAQLDALSCARYEDTLTVIMRLWWLSHTFSVTYASVTVTTLGCMKGTDGGPSNYWAATPIVPRDRVCISYDPNTSRLGEEGPAFVTAEADRWYTSEGPSVLFWFRGVRYNTTTSLYALLIGWYIGGGPDGVYATGDERSADPNLGTYSANAGSFTFLGVTQPAGLKQTAKGNATLVIESPTYYTV